jgi:endonuclease G
MMTRFFNVNLGRCLASAFMAVALVSCGSGANSKSETKKTTAGNNTQGCARFFPKGVEPAVRNKKMLENTQILCKRAFVLRHSAVARQSLWVAEALTKEQIELGYNVPRVDNFHPEEFLGPQERAELRDYAKSGYDRGHMAPDADMPTREAEFEAFSLANMSPQAPGLNRNSWAQLEGSVRRQTREGKVFVVTGPLFQDAKIKTTKKDGRLFIPSHFFKAVYVENIGATVFVATNSNTPKWSNFSVNQFAAAYGIDPFPALDPDMRMENATIAENMARLKKKKESAKSGQQGTASGGNATMAYPEEQAHCNAVNDEIVRNPNGAGSVTPREFHRITGRPPRPMEYCN